MKFNNKRYRELLMYSQKLKQQQKSLSNSNYRELLSYSAKTDERLELELLDSYLTSINKFLEGKISKGDFFFEYIELQNWHQQIEQLEVFLKMEMFLIFVFHAKVSQISLKNIQHLIAN